MAPKAEKNGREPIFFSAAFAAAETRLAQRHEPLRTARALRSTLNRREDQIESLLAPTIEALGCELWGVEYQAQGRHSRLRVYIERPDGVSVEDCERVSREVSDLLDVEDVIAASYVLEVSSPGMDRILFKADHYQANLGAVVDVRLNFPVDGRKHIVGVLAALEDDEVVVRPREEDNPDGEEYVVPLENIHRARLVPQFD